MSNLAIIYMKRFYPAQNIKFGMQVKVLKLYSAGPYVKAGDIGTVIDSQICDSDRCKVEQKDSCNGYIISAKISEDCTAHSCYLSFCTLDDIPIVYKEE